MTARFAGTCRICNGPIAKGQEIIWAKGHGARHPGCTREGNAARQDMANSQAAWNSTMARRHAPPASHPDAMADSLHTGDTNYCPDPGEVAMDNFAAAQGYAAESYHEARGY
jgi:hypothetical protein